MEGPDSANNNASNPSGIHMPRPKKVASMLEKKVAMPPMATPIAATVPTSIFLGSGFFTSTSCGVLSTWAVAVAVDSTLPRAS